MCKFRELFQSASTQTFYAGQPIDMLGKVGLIQKGVVIASKVDERGNKRAYRIITAGDVILPATDDTLFETFTQSAIAFIPLATAKAAIDYTEAVLANATKDNRALTEALWQADGAIPARDRLRWAIDAIGDAFVDSGLNINFIRVFTNKDYHLRGGLGGLLASLCGMRAESVSRAFKEVRRDYV